MLLFFVSLNGIGYDILIDENLKPWLLEVNASPSLSANTQEDTDMKMHMLHGLLDIVDITGERTGDEEHVSGWDLVYDNGYIEVDPDQCGYTTFLGAAVPSCPYEAMRRQKSRPVLEPMLDTNVPRTVFYKEKSYNNISSTYLPSHMKLSSSEVRKAGNTFSFSSKKKTGLLIRDYISVTDFQSLQHAINKDISHEIYKTSI